MLTFEEFNKILEEIDNDEIEEGALTPFKHQMKNLAKGAVRAATGYNHIRNSILVHHVNQARVHHDIIKDPNASAEQKAKSKKKLEYHKQSLEKHMTVEDD